MLEVLTRRVVHVPRHKYAIARMRWSGLNGLFCERDRDAYAPQAYDLWFLYRQVRRRRPQHVLEFGSGNSTLVIGEALRRNGAGAAVSIESDPRWATDVRRSLHRLPVTLTNASLAMTEVGGEKCHTYSGYGAPECIDLLFLDGPSPRDVPGWTQKKPISADPVMLEGRFARGFRMIVDARKDNVAFLKRYLRRRYLVRTDNVFKITTFDLID